MSIEKRMALDPRTIQKPFRKLRKLLKNFPDPPAPEDVHDVRTHTRRVEALLGILGCDRKTASQLIKTLKPIRKAAGEVRDMDVLTDFSASLEPGDHGDCRLKLMEHLATRRIKAATKLCKKVDGNAKEARDLLKQSGKMANSGLDAANTSNGKAANKQKSRRKSADSMASALQMQQELRDWPKLTEKNIHSFRLKVKQLRYLLEVAQNKDAKLVDVLGEVKDQIGLWHDWNELGTIAGEALDDDSKCPVTVQIRTRTERELEKALKSANALRMQYFGMQAGNGKKRPGKELHPVVIEATARLAS